MKEKKTHCASKFYKSLPKYTLHFKLGDNHPACSSHSPAGSQMPLKDWIQACHPALRKTTDPKACTLHLEGMLIQTKPKGSKITMAVLEQMALCCLWKSKINPEVRTRKCSHTVEALHACLPAFGALHERLLSLNTSPPALTFMSQVASCSGRSLSLNFKTSG